MRDFILRSRRAKRFRLAAFILIPPLPIIVTAIVGAIIVLGTLYERYEAHNEALVAYETVDGLTAQITERLFSVTNLSPEEVSEEFRLANDAYNGNGTYFVVRSDNPREDRARYHFFRAFGLAFEKANDLPDAIKCATEALALDRKRILEGGNEAGEFFTNVLQGFEAQRRPASAIDWFIDLERRSGDLPAAIKAAEDQLDIHQRLFTKNPEPWRDREIWDSYRRIGGLRLERNDVEGAAAANGQMLAMAQQAFARAAGEGPGALAPARNDLSVSLRTIASVKEAQSDLAGAIAAYEEGVSYDRHLFSPFQSAGDNIKVARELVTLGNMQGKAGNLSGKHLSYTEALELIKDDDRGGFLAGEAKDLPNWLRQEIAKLSPDSTLTPAQRDWDDCRAGDPDRVIASCTNIVQARNETANNHAVAYYNRGRAYEDKDDLDNAIADFSAAIEVNPEYAEAFNARCYVLTITNRSLKQALSDCNESVRLRPGLAISYDTRGFLHLRLGQHYKEYFDAAYSDYGTALAFAPEAASSFYGRGIAELKTGHDDHGNADISRAKTIQDDIANKFTRYGLN